MRGVAQLAALTCWLTVVKVLRVTPMHQHQDNQPDPPAFTEAQLTRAWQRWRDGLRLFRTDGTTDLASDADFLRQIHDGLNVLLAKVQRKSLRLYT
jgi:hypothetical protein